MLDLQARGFVVTRSALQGEAAFGSFTSAAQGGPHLPAESEQVALIGSNTASSA